MTVYYLDTSAAELTRAMTRLHPVTLPDVRDLLGAFTFVGIDTDVVELAMSESDANPRSLDAIQLATARLLAPDLDALVTYDDRLATTATRAGIAVASPRD